MDLEMDNLAGQTILEVGSGRGGTTRKLVDLLEGQPGATLIAADVSDRFFSELHDAFNNRRVNVRFEKTGAAQLDNIDDNSVTTLICNYTLCAVNARPGTVALALRRFREVLKVGGTLLVEEELPIDRYSSSRQEVWAEKWRLLKSVMMLAGESPYNEIAPETLAALCRLTGFKDVEWSMHSKIYADEDVLDFFQRRLECLLPELPNEHLRTGFFEMVEALQAKARDVCGMETPYYRLRGVKPAG
jgi:ubiquinone/menaquinone biosynthesis C-methylase UbiE